MFEMWNVLRSQVVSNKDKVVSNPILKFEKNLINFFVISSNLNDLRQNGPNRKRLLIGWLITIFITSMAIRAITILIASDNQQIKFLLGDFLVGLGSAGKTIYVFFLGSGMITVFYRFGMHLGDFHQKLDFVTDLSHLINNEPEQLKLNPTGLLKLTTKIKKSLLPVKVMITLITTASVTITVAAVIKSAQLTDSWLMVSSYIIWSIITFWLAFVLCASLYPIQSSWDISTLFLKLRIRQVTDQLRVFVAARAQISPATIKRVICEMNDVITLTMKYNAYMGRWIGFNLCYICAPYTGCLLFLLIYVDYNTPLVKYAVISISGPAFLSYCYFASRAAGVFNEVTWFTIVNCNNIFIKFSDTSCVPTSKRTHGS